ncbi:MAG TPA: polynucleotide adenylyltransferase PcnB [Polyangiaceae bacterium]|nr:polynucleotide adenylyltransferase PcnB [Polyangiaceae bacterium]
MLGEPRRAGAQTAPEVVVVPPSSRSKTDTDESKSKASRRTKTRTRRPKDGDAAASRNEATTAARSSTSSAKPKPPRATPPPPDEHEPELHDVELDEARIDPDAAKVVRRLVRHGHEAYLVGGCVRDLLVGQSPKDFDVATSARPDDVRRLFRNSRIIGRRFRLVHVLFSGGKVIETATFRRPPQEQDSRDGEDLLIRNDNVFGEAHEDAERRDFTINGLFYDIEECQVLDWVKGMPDIRRRVVHTIGDPVVRFQEDPIRILRAIKFSARLDFGISPDVYDAIVQCRGTLSMAARPRLFEEVLRLMRGGACHRSIWLAWETGVLDVVLPELSAYLSDEDASARETWGLLSRVDARTREVGRPLDDVVLFTSLLLGPIREACFGERDRVSAAYEFLEPVVDRLNVPRRIADAIRRVIAILPRLQAGKTGRFSKTPLYPLALEVLALADQNAGHDAPMGARAELPPKPRRRRRRRRPTSEDG